MYTFIVEKKDAKDQSVTGTYMGILRKACALSGKVDTMAIGEKSCSKREYVISDTIQTSFRYFMYGYRKQIVWMQGVVPEESFMRRKSKLRFAVLSWMEKYVLKHSKMLLLVSEEMLRHYEKKYRLSLRQKSVIMPCFNETELVETAFSPEKYKKNTYLYVGGMAKWQCFPEMAKLFKIIEEKDRDAVFYVYTFEREKAKAVLQECGVQHYQVDYAPKEVLSEKIQGIKYGFVLREDCAVNNVATPTKFSNYLANGIIPIYSDSLRDFAEVDAEYQIGVVCNIDDLEAGAERVLAHGSQPVDSAVIKQKCQSIFDSYYAQERYIENIREKLNAL